MLLFQLLYDVNDHGFNENDETESENIETDGISLSKYTWHDKENSQCSSFDKKAKNVDYEYTDHETPKKLNSFVNKLKTVLTDKKMI